MWTWEGGRKWQDRDNYILGSFMVCTVHKILLGTSVSWTKHVKGTAFPVLDYCRYREFQELEAPWISNGTWRWQGCQPYAPAAFTPCLRQYLWYSFLLEAELTPRLQCGRKDYVNEKFLWHHREPNPPPPGACPDEAFSRYKTYKGMVE